MFAIIGLILALATFVAIAVFLRWLGDRENPTAVVVQAANTTALVLLKPNKLEKDKDGKTIGVSGTKGGDVVNVIHAVSGQVLDKSDPDNMNWHIRPPRKSESVDQRGLLQRLIGVKIIWFFRYLRINEVRQHRWGRKGDEDKYHMMSKTQYTRFPYFSGQHDIELKGVETRKIIKFDMRFNLTTQETYPVRVRLRLADPYAVLTNFVSQHVIQKIGAIDPHEFIAGADQTRETLKVDLKKELVESFTKPKEGEEKSEIVVLIEKETGITIREVNLPDFDFDDKTRELLEKQARAEIEGNAAITTAQKGAVAAKARGEGVRDEKRAEYEAEAWRTQNVLLPMAANDRTVQVKQADAYENNDTATTVIAPGSGVQPMLPIGTGTGRGKL